MTNSLTFTDGARAVLANARRQAAALRHEFLGTEHILLGILESEDAAVAAALAGLGVQPTVLRETILNAVQHGSAGSGGGDIPFTSRAKKALEEAMAEARGLDSSDVDTRHLLLGLARENGIAGQVLSHSGADLASLRAAF